MTKRKLPAATEFSPGIVDLKELLALVDQAADRDAAAESIRLKYFSQSATAQSDPAERLRNQHKRAQNVLIGLRQYELTNAEAQLTELGHTVSGLPKEEAHEALASHILTSLHGLEVLKAISDLEDRGVPVSKATLAAELKAAPHNFEMPKDTTNHLILLRWLREAGVLPAASGDYSIDDKRVAALTGGISVGVLNEWEELTHAQQAYVKTLARMASVTGGAEVPAKDVRAQAEQEHGDIFTGANMAAAIYKPLIEAGWITQTGSTAKGAKSGKVAPTPKLLGVDLALLTGFAPPALPHEIRSKVNTPLSEIRLGLKAMTAGGEPDTYARGIALELLAVRLVRDLGLSPVDFRKRGIKTGGAEVDLIAEGAHLHFSRWLVQCKNVETKADLNTLAKEVGLAVLLQAHVVLIVSTSGFKSSVHHYAERTAATSALQVILVGGGTVTKYLSSGANSLREHFHESALETMRLKGPQISDLER